jgi:hypothetical protein
MLTELTILAAAQGKTYRETGDNLWRRRLCATKEGTL